MVQNLLLQFGERCSVLNVESLMMFLLQQNYCCWLSYNWMVFTWQRKI